MLFSLLALLLVTAVHGEFDTARTTPQFVDSINNAGSVMNGGGRTYDSCRFVEMRDRTVVKLFWTVNGNNIDVAAAIQFSKLAQGGWFAVGTSPDNNADLNGMTGADMVIGYVDRVGNGFGYMAGMTSATQTAPTIKNPFKPVNAKIGVSSIQEGASTVDDLEIMEFTISKALWGNGAPVSLLVSYRNADVLFDVMRAPQPGTTLQSGKHTDRIRIKNFDFDTRSTCNELPASLSPQPTLTINGVDQVDTFNLCPQFPSGSFDMSGEFGSKAVLSWVHLCDDTLTNFTLVAVTDGWVGLGFNDRPLNDEAMVGSDLMQFSADGRTSLNGAPAGTTNARPIAFRSTAFRPNTLRITTKISTKELTATFQRAWFATDANHSSLSSVNGLSVLLARNDVSRLLTTKHQKAAIISKKLSFFAKNDPLPLAPPPTTRPGGTPAPPAADPNPCVANPKDVFSNSIAATAGAVAFTLKWTIDCAQKTIKFEVSADSDGWIAFGLNDSGEMESTDTYQVSVDTAGKTVVRNGVAASYDIEEDAIVPGATGSRVGKKLTVSFERPLAASRATDKAITFAKPLVVNVAASTSASFASKHNVKGSTKKVQFLTKGDPFNPPKAPAPPAPTTLGGGGGSDGTNAGGDNPCPGAPEKLSNKVTVSFKNGDPVDIAYVIDCLKKTVEFTVTGKSAGWLAIGLNTVPNQMGGTDVYQLGVEGGTFKVRNGFNQGKSLNPDGFIDGAKGESAGGVVTGTFTRALDTGSETDRAIKPGAKLVLVIARGGAGQSFDAIHNDKTTTGAGIDLFEGGQAVGGGSSLKVLVGIHGFLMLTAWSVFSVVGTFFARFLKDLGHSWYLVHRGLMTAVVFLTFVGFILITIEVGDDGLHYNSAHALLGVLVVMFTIAQPLLGILSNRWWSPNRNGTPVFPDQAHWWLGRLVILCGFVACLLGLLRANDDNFSGAVIVFLLWSIVAVVYSALGQKFIGAIHHNAAPFDQEPKKVDSIAWRNVSFALLAIGTLVAAITIVILAFTSPF